MAVVRHVEYENGIGWTVISELGPGVVAKSFEDNAVKIMTINVYQQTVKASILKRVIWISGIMVFLGIAVYIILFTLK